ncbi:MAG: hypothetical protein QOJ41_3093 [Acidobacteriaceae bacterium]|jgi:hypothetical protein|nr:hypothetical protein [Acidobacteriaceae bacterium]
MGSEYQDLRLLGCRGPGLHQRTIEFSLSLPERVPGATGEVRLGITSGQDTTDRVRAVRRSRPEAAGRGKARDLHVPGLHPLL